MRLLAGVGDTEREHWMDGDVAFHLRRALSDSELAALPRDWLDLPAIDPGGE